MNATSRRLAWLVGAMAVAVLAESPGRTAGAGSDTAASSPLAEQVQYGSKSDDLVQELCRLAAASPTPINLEFVAKCRPSEKGDPFQFVAKGWSVPAGEHRVDEVLSLMRHALPGLKWDVDGSAVNVVVRLQKGVDDPFDRIVREDEGGSLKAWEWCDWLARKLPGSGIHAWPLIRWGPSDEDPEDAATVHVATMGATARHIMNAVALGTKTWWEASILDRNPWTASVVRDGDVVPLPYDPNRKDGRAMVEFHRCLPIGWESF